MWSYNDENTIKFNKGPIKHFKSLKLQVEQFCLFQPLQN